MAKGGEFILPSDNLPDIFTVTDLNDEQRLIRDTIRELVTKSLITDEAVKLIETKDFRFSRGLLRNLAELGFLGIEVPEAYGGTDLGTVVSAIVAEEIARQGSFACTFLAHTGIGTLPIKFFGTEDQKKKYLPKLTSGEWVAAYSLTEGGAGSDANGVKTTAVLSEDSSHFVLNGEKIFVTNGGFADLFIIFAKVDGKDLTAFIVERGFEGLKVGREEHKMGIQGTSTATIILDSVRVPVENLLGERGKGFKIAVNILNLGRFKLGAACLGGGRMCFGQSLAYAKQRKQFGVPIVGFGAIRQKLALMAANNFAMQSVIYRTAGLLEEAIHKVDAADSRSVLKAIEEYAVECALVKVFCSEALDFIVDENVQIHGGSGFCEGNPERHYRDSRINRIFEGTNEINRLLAVGQLLKRSMTGGLPLMAVGKKLLDEAMSPTMSSEPDDEVERLGHYLNNAKKAVILAAGAAWEKFNFKLEEHQIVLMGLADCLISVYVLESALAALAKNRNDHDANLVRLVFDGKLFEIETAVRRLVAMCAEGDTQRTINAMVKRLLKFTPVNTEELTENIVSNLLEA